MLNLRILHYALFQQKGNFPPFYHFHFPTRVPFLSLCKQLTFQAWWLSGSPPDCYPAVLGSNLVTPQPTADGQSSGGLPPKMALAAGWPLWGETEEKNMINEPLVSQKHIQKKKDYCLSRVAAFFIYTLGGSCLDFEFLPLISKA